MANVERGLTPPASLINAYSLSKCGHSASGKPAGEKSSPLKYSYTQIAKAPAK